MGVQNPTKRFTRCMQTAQEQRDASIISTVASGMSRHRVVNWSRILLVETYQSIPITNTMTRQDSWPGSGAIAWWRQEVDPAPILASFGTTGLTDPIFYADERPLFKSTPEATPGKQGKSFSQPKILVPAPALL